MATSVMVAAYFACMYSAERAQLAVLVQHIEQATKRIFAVAEFRFYATAAPVWPPERHWRGSTRSQIQSLALLPLAL